MTPFSRACVDQEYSGMSSLNIHIDLHICVTTVSTHSRLFIELPNVTNNVFLHHLNFLYAFFFGKCHYQSDPVAAQLLLKNISKNFFLGKSSVLV